MAVSEYGAAPGGMGDMRSDRPSNTEPPGDITERISRATQRMRDLAPQRNECWQFFRGHTYTYRTQENRLVAQATAPSAEGHGKPSHRVRNSRPIHLPVIRQEIAYATQRVPGYEVSPSNTDPEVQNAARIASKVALFGYDKWRIKRVTEKVVTHALVADAGYAWPYWDTTAGPSLGTDEQTGKELHEGEVCIRTYSSNQVGWEPGQDFEDSRWYVVIQAMPIDQVRELPGYLPGDLVPDAIDPYVIGLARPTRNNLVMVTEYLERPSHKHKTGRRVCIANGRQITPITNYPLQGPDGRVLDEPVLHKLTWMTDPDSDQDLGLLRFLLDIVRSYQDAVNKQLEWKNLAMNPQMLVQPGLLTTPLTDEPGAIVKVGRPDLVQWRPTPPVPPVLSEIQDRAKQDLGFVASQNEIPSQVEAARAIQVLTERDQNARSAFIANLAEWHSRLMRHCLALVARHYTEGRLVKINGWSGPEVIRDFKGSDLRDQIDVRVLPGSIEPITRQAVEQKVMTWAGLGWIAPHQAMAAIDGGTAEGLVRSYELDIARANRIIQQIFTDPESVLAGPTVPGPMMPDPITGQPIRQDVPWWMPRPFDAIPIYKTQFENAMKTERYDQSPPHIQEMLQLAYAGLLQLEAQQQAQAIEAQNAMAENLGMSNAAKPQDGKAMPDRPGIPGPGGQPGEPATAGEPEPGAPRTPTGLPQMSG